MSVLPCFRTHTKLVHAHFASKVQSLQAKCALKIGVRRPSAHLKAFSWEEKLVAPLIATPNVDRAIEDKKDVQKSYATGYTCNSRLQKGLTIFFFANKLDDVLVRITLVV